MENKSKLLGLLIFLFGTIFISDIWAQMDNRLNGRWVGTEQGVSIEYRFNNGNYEHFINGVQAMKGTYIVNAGNITFTPTHVGGGYFSQMGLQGFESRWYTNNEVIIIMRNMLLNSGSDEESINELIAMMMPSSSNNITYSYSVDNNSLILTTHIEGMRLVHILSKR
ncbi:MAG: hypothetical protein FWC01_07775 [Treponema sp.]|nr:hypothetical protein [Treponema sp.]MCL2237795.1 hypothetical protein [Treponema sp.]